MSTRSAEEQIRELAQDLAPVRPIPPLRGALTAAVALGLVALAAHRLLGGPDLRHAGSAVWSLPYLGTLAGLSLMALGALGAALAASVPGREAAARLGTRVAVAGVLLAVAGGLWGLAGGVAGGASFADCLSCAGRAVALGAAPVLLACAFAVYAAVRRSGPRTALAVAGGVALGAAAVHVTCPSDSPLHWLLAHTLAPVMAVGVLTAPVAALLARLTPRD